MVTRFNTDRKTYLLTLLLVVTLLLGACGGRAEPTPAAEAPAAAAPLAQQEPTATPAPTTPAPAPTEAPAAEPAAQAAPTAEAAEEPVAAESEAAPAGDLTAAVDSYISAIPEGYMAVGKLDAFKEILETGQAVLIDVREESEYSAGHIEGAVNIPIRMLAQQLEMIPTDQPVFIYCASGHRAGIATSALRLLGYENVRAFPPGWRGWSAANEPVSTEAVAGASYAMPELDAELVAAVDEFLSAIPEGFYAVGSMDALAQAMDAGAVLVDVREESEYNEGAIPGALGIPLRTLVANLDAIPSDQPVIVYCASGHRAALAITALHVLGYENVRSFPAGYPAWEAANGEDGPAPAADAAASPAADDLVGAVNEYLNNIPEGYMAVGKLDAFKDLLESANPLLIDVREESEYSAGHIEGAINIPIRTLAQNLELIPTDRPVMIYCASGHRAGLATAGLSMLGYSNVRAYPPGWKGWSAAGEPVSTEAVTAESYAAPEVDGAMLAAVDEFLSNLPEGYYSLGTVEKLQEAIDAGAALIDVREPSEYAEGYIPGAVDIPIRTLAQQLEQVPADGPVVVYCASGHRAALATAALHIMGYNNVRSFPPSFGAWAAAGEPVEQ
jgi:rhodanese-related sulfurtransferase